MVGRGGSHKEDEDLQPGEEPGGVQHFILMDLHHVLYRITVPWVFKGREMTDEEKFLVQSHQSLFDIWNDTVSLDNLNKQLFPIMCLNKHTNQWDKILKWTIHKSIWNSNVKLHLEKILIKITIQKRRERISRTTPFLQFCCFPNCM